MKDIRIGRFREWKFFWHDFFYNIILIILVIVHFSRTVHMFTQFKDIYHSIFDAICLILCCVIFSNYFPFRKNYVRKYPSIIYRFTMIYFSFIIVNVIVSEMIAIFVIWNGRFVDTLISMTIINLIWLLLPMLSLIYFYKRRKYFGVKETSTTNRNKEEQNQHLEKVKKNEIVKQSVVSKKRINKMSESEIIISLQGYKDLVDNGVITTEEFEQKKNELLNK